MPVHSRAVRSNLVSLSGDEPTVVMRKGDADPTLLFRRRLKAASRASSAPPPSASHPATPSAAQSGPVATSTGKRPSPPPEPPRSERSSAFPTTPPTSDGDRASGARRIIRAQALLDSRPSLPFEGVRWWLRSRKGTLTIRAVVLLVFGGSIG